MFRSRDRQLHHAMQGIRAIRECLIQMRSMDTFSAIEKEEIDEAAGSLQNVIRSWEAKDIACRKESRHRFLGFISG